ncbi:MAG: GNAT family N-acetyltransferase [Pirellulaceae bacterium]|nr:GNAT family N-acetyltransferase [Pirellulaceae bacterium]
MQCLIRSVPPDNLAGLLLEIQSDSEPSPLELDGQGTAREESVAGDESLACYERPDILLAAEIRGRPRGAAWARLVPGGMARVWPCQVAAGAEEGLAGRLLDRLHDLLAERNVELAQCLVRNPSLAAARQLLEWGYQHVADLDFLVGVLSERVEPPSLGPFVCRPYAPLTDRPRLARILEQSYERSLDLPAIGQWRTLDRIMEGYEGSLPAACRHWWLVEFECQVVGCLLLADQPDQDQWELVYLGLCPSVRGRGWGQRLVQFAQWSTRRAGRSKLVLAVDSANRPALAIYERAGLECWDRQSLLLAGLPPSGIRK